MTVKELITKLEKMPKKARIVFPNHYVGDYEDIMRVEKQNLYDSPSRGIIDPYRKDEKEKSFKAVVIFDF